MVRKSDESGVAILYILIAITLFAALGYAFSNSMQSAPQALTEEEAKVYAQDILSFASRVERGVQRTLQRGCSESDVSFYLSTMTPLAAYEHTPEVDDTCKVFHESGGAITWREPDPNANDGTDWTFSGNNRIAVVGTDTSANSVGNDLVAFLPNVDREICIEINNLMGITNTNSAPPKENDNMDLTEYTGGFSTTTLIQTSANETDGKPTGCYEATQVDGVAAAGTYHFYHVLIVR